MERNTFFSFKMLGPKYWLVWFGMALWWLTVQLLPFRVLMWLGGLLGRLAGLLSPRRRIIARKNIEMCFPELSQKEQNALLWQTLESTGKGFIDTGIAWFLPAWRLDPLIDISGMEELLDAYERGDGVVLFMYHFTSLEMSLAGFNRNYPHEVFGVYRPHGNSVYDFIMRLGRERHGERKTALPRKDVRGMVRALRQGKLTIYLPDQDYGQRYSTFVPFFGVDAATVTAPTQLVKMSKARVFSFCVARKADNTGYLLKVYPEFKAYAEVDADTDARVMNQFLEERIREYPEQYLWVHRRFKSRQDGEPDFYGLEALKSFRRRQKRRAKAHLRSKKHD